MGNVEQRLPDWSVEGHKELDASPWQIHVTEFMERVLRSVPASHWALAIFDERRNLLEFHLSESGIDSRAALDIIYTKPVPEPNGATSISASQTYIEGAHFPWQLTAFAVTPGKRAAKLVLLRSANEPGFALSAPRDARAAIAAFARALGLREPSRADGAAVAHARRFPQPAMYLLDADLSILFMWRPKDLGSIALAQLVEPRDGHLPVFIESTVRHMTRDWNLSRIDTCIAGVAHPVPGMLLRTIPMASANGVAVGVVIEPYQTRRSMRTNAAKFRISRRERDVLLLLFDGYSISEIAAKLHLAESTVQDHVKRMIFKTDSHNRIEMAAKLLGWPLSRTSEA